MLKMFHRPSSVRESRPSILVVTRNLPPLIGGMERLLWHIVDGLEKSYSVIVVGPKGCRAHLPASVTTIEVPLTSLPRFLIACAWATLSQAFRYRPNIIFAGSGLTAPIAWLAARLTGVRSVAYLHGLDIVVDQPIYRLFWRPFFRRLDQVIVNSRYTRMLALKAGVESEAISILNPGVDLPALTDQKHRREIFRDRHRLGETPVMLYVGRINARKGLLVFVREILPIIMKAVPEARLVVVGDEPKNALTGAGGEQAKVQDTLRRTGLEAAVAFLGPQDDRALSDAYFAADVMVFPVQEVPGDVEGFGMVAIEAAAHNLPTVAFAAGGVTDAVADGRSGSLVEAGANALFADSVINQLQSREALDCREFAQGFSWQKFSLRLKMLLEKKSPPQTK